MSKAIIPRDPDQAQGVVDSVVYDGVTAGIVVGTIVVHAMVPIFGWAVLLAGGTAVGWRAVKRGLKNRKSR